MWSIALNITPSASCTQMGRRESLDAFSTRSVRRASGFVQARLRLGIRLPLGRAVPMSDLCHQLSRKGHLGDRSPSLKHFFLSPFPFNHFPSYPPKTPWLACYRRGYRRPYGNPETNSRQSLQRTTL